MEVKDELMDIVEKVWHKLQSLPDASTLELGAFSVIILFFGKKVKVHTIAQLLFFQLKQSHFPSQGFSMDVFFF